MGAVRLSLQRFQLVLRLYISFACYNSCNIIFIDVIHTIIELTVHIQMCAPYPPHIPNSPIVLFQNWCILKYYLSV